MLTGIYLTSSASIVGGLLLSQLLTLYTTPVVYFYLDRFSCGCAAGAIVSAAPNGCRFSCKNTQKVAT
jgi:hypothetical protein